MEKIIACAIIALPIILPTGNVTAQTLPDLVQKVKLSVAFVSVRTDQGQACGSAFVVDSSGILITALHVVEDAQTVSIQFPGADLQPALHQDYPDRCRCDTTVHYGGCGARGRRSGKRSVAV